jgi:hypothetical protein
MELKKIYPSSLVRNGRAIHIEPDGEFIMSPEDFKALTLLVTGQGLDVQTLRKKYGERTWNR